MIESLRCSIDTLINFIWFLFSLFGSLVCYYAFMFVIIIFLGICFSGKE